MAMISERPPEIGDRAVRATGGRFSSPAAAPSAIGTLVERTTSSRSCAPARRARRRTRPRPSSTDAAPAQTPAQQPPGQGAELALHTIAPRHGRLLLRPPPVAAPPDPRLCAVLPQPAFVYRGLLGGRHSDRPATLLEPRDHAVDAVSQQRPARLKVCNHTRTA